MKVPLLDLKRQFEGIKDEIMAATEEVYQSQQFILGPKVVELEDNVATYCKGKYAVGVSSGTDALLISLMAAGVGIGDVVVTTPYTFFATVGAIVRVGAQPLFVDIDSKTYNMDPGKLEDALYAYDKTIAINPEYPGVWFNKGVVLGKLERYAEEIHAYDKALELNPEDEDAMANKNAAIKKTGG